jgi:hypothetical protein
VTIAINAVDSINETVISKNCKSPQKVAGLLLSYSGAVRTSDVPSVTIDLKIGAIS